MASNLRIFLSKGSRLTPKCLQVLKQKTFMSNNSTQRFFGGRNWDPFSDLNSALKEFERNSKEVQKTFERLSQNTGFPSSIFRGTNIPVQGR